MASEEPVYFDLETVALLRETLKDALGPALRPNSQPRRAAHSWPNAFLDHHPQPNVVDCCTSLSGRRGRISPAAYCGAHDSWRLVETSGTAHTHPIKLGTESVTTSAPANTW